MTEPLTVTQNTLSTTSVGWIVLYEAEQGTYALCPWAGLSSSVNPVSLSGSSALLQHRIVEAMVKPGSSFGLNCRSKLGLDIEQKEESKRKV